MNTLIPHSGRGAIGEGNTSRRGGGPVLLFDAQCSICRRFASVLMQRDRVGTLRIAPLQSVFGDAIRRSHAQFAQRDSALWVYPDGRVVGFSDAILASLEYLGGVWPSIAQSIRRLPEHLRNSAYFVFAGNRLRFSWFGLSRMDPRVAARHALLARWETMLSARENQ